VVARRHSSSSSNHSSINHKKLIKSETDKHANTERIFDWLMQNHHSNINDHDEEHSEEQISNLKKNFQTKIIPLEATDSSLIQSDIRLKVYSSRNDQSIKSICLPFLNFAKTLIKSSNTSMIINPKAYLKHSLNEDLFINKELDERIKLLDKQIQISSSVLLSTMSTSSLISPTLYNDTSNTNLSIKSLEQFDSSIKFKHKPIPPPLSVITTLPVSSNTNESPIYPTPSSVLGSQHHSPGTIFSPVSKQQTNVNSPKPTVLKSILKPPSHHLLQSASNETRKAVHIISTKSPLECTIKSSSKPITPRPIETKKFKLIETIKKASSITKTAPVLSKIPKITSQSSEIKKKSLTISTKKRLPNNETLKAKSQPSIINMKKSEQKLPNSHQKILKKPTTELSKKKLILKQTSSMYDRIKQRARNDQIRNRYVLYISHQIHTFIFLLFSLLSTKDDANQQLKRKVINIIFESIF
jgi:hypothetical protein